MRILQVNDINQVATIYAGELINRGHSVEVYEPSLSGGSAPLPIKLAAMPRRLLSLRYIVGSLNPNHFDIMHIHWASYGILGLVGRIPFIVHCHGSDVRYRLKQGVMSPILTYLLRHADAVMCITPDLLPIVRTVRPDAIFVPGPVDTEQFAPDERALLPHPWTILLFARLDPEKGTEIAIRGIMQFIQRHREVCVKLIDWGSEKEKYKQHYGQQFEFVPRVEPRLVQHLILSADIVVGQLACGALGLSELQAMSCSKPLIASFRYENAYPTPPPLLQATSSQEVDEHLEYLFQHPRTAKEIGQREREWIINYHSHYALSEKLEKLYLSIFNHQQREYSFTKDLHS